MLQMITPKVSHDLRFSHDQTIMYMYIRVLSAQPISAERRIIVHAVKGRRHNNAPAP